MAAKRPSHSDDAGPVRKKKKAYCHFKSAWKSQEFTVTVGGAEKTVSGKILSGVEGADNAKCTACGVAFSVCHGGANDVIKNISRHKIIGKPYLPRQWDEHFLESSY